MAERSTSRILPEAGFVDADKLPRGPNGRALCRRCGEEVPKGCRTFCSDTCVHEWKIRSNPGYAASQVLKRDAGTCATCGTDCVTLLRELQEERHAERKARWNVSDTVQTFALPSDTKLPGFSGRCDQLGLPAHLRRLTRRLWEMNHRVAVVEGGGSCGLENLETLCWACHARHTKELAGRRAKNKQASDVVPFDALVADPPWAFDDALPGKGRGAAKHYGTMSVEQIQAFPLPPLARDCWLFLWRPATHQAEALAVARAWGFEAAPAELIWRKMTLDGSRVRIGMGRSVRNAHETCLVFRRGKPERLSAAIPSVFDAPRLNHSRKPDRFYRIVDALAGGRKAELFARRQWKQWTCLGNQMPVAAE